MPYTRYTPSSNSRLGQGYMPTDDERQLVGWNRGSSSSPSYTRNTLSSNSRLGQGYMPTDDERQVIDWNRGSSPSRTSSSNRPTTGTSGGMNANNRVSAGAAGSTGAAFDYGGFERRQRDIYDRSARDSIQNAYGRFIAQQRGTRDLGDMQRQFGYNTPSFLASFAQRGIGGPGIRSGIETEQKDRFFGSYARDRGRLAQDITQQLQQFDLNQAEIDAMRQNALAQLEADKANEIAMTAENLEFLRQMIGGL